MRAATIDIGSNSILLCIAEPDSTTTDGIRILQNETRTTGLAKGLQAGTDISEASLERSKAALAEYRQFVDDQQVDRLYVVATEGLRRAKNSAQVKKSLEDTIQSEIEIISGEREAELSFHSVQKAHPELETPKIVFDIGGASTEIAFGDHQGIQKWASLKVGSVLLTEKFELKDQSFERKDEAVRYVQSLIREQAFESSPKALGIGVAGTMTTLIAVNQGLEAFEREKVHFAKLRRDELDSITQRVLDAGSKERLQIKGLPSDRADVFGGGCCIATAILAYFQWPELLCMDSGIRIGLMYDVLG